MSAFWLMALLVVALIGFWAILGGYLSAGDIGVKRDWRTLTDRDEDDHPSAK
jgi:hypothetical protein